MGGRYENGAARRKARGAVVALWAWRPCPWCGATMDPTLTTWVDPKDGKTKRHPMSMEVDEIVPASLGGSVTDPTNLRCLHRMCNQKRGNSTRLKPPDPRQRPHGSREW